MAEMTAVQQLGEQLVLMNRNFSFFKPTRNYRELIILSEVEKDATVSQRTLSKKARVSATMINTYLTTMAERGLIQTDGNTNRTYRYALTDTGKALKNSLFFQCSREIIQMYGLMKQEFQRRLEKHYQDGVRRAVLFGGAETGELVYVAALETPIQIVGIVDSDAKRHGKKIGNLLISDPKAMATFKPDAVIITSFGHMEEIFESTRSMDTEGIRVLRL